MRRRLIALCVLIVAIAGTAFLLRFLNRPSALENMRAAAAQNNPQLVLTLGSDQCESGDASPEAWLLTLEAAIRLNQPSAVYELAAECPATQFPPDFRQRIMAPLQQLAQSALQEGDAAAAENLYRRTLEIDPNNILSNRRLASLYLGEARRWESVPLLFRLLKSREFTLEELCFLGSIDELYSAEELMAFFEEAHPENLIPLIGRARLLMFKSDLSEAAALLQQIVQQHPDAPEALEARVLQGVILVTDKGESVTEENSYRDWHRSLPPEADQHPEVWWVRAMYARSEGQLKAAVRCAWEAVRLDPNHLGATYQLSQLLAADGNREAAEYFAERAERLEGLVSAINNILLREPTPELMKEAAMISEQLGRLHEAWGWYEALAVYFPNESQGEERRRIASLLTDDMPLVVADHQPAELYSFEHYPLPADAVTAVAADIRGSRFGPIRFQQAPVGIGPSFTYLNGMQEDARGLIIYQSIGNGCTVTDFDIDGSPDLFFAQAFAGSPLTDNPPDASDVLIRNRAGKAIDVSDRALPPDRDYGFAAAAGDFNCDGFPDLYVANAGRNRLWTNNGDGTFSEESSGVIGRSSEWTSCVLMADLTGDGIPELMDVNYCGGRRPFEHICYREGGVSPRTCIPTEFEAADDRLLLNRGDGEFTDVTSDAGILAPDGRGLGVLVGQLDDTAGNDVYVANDMTANFLFLNRTESGGVPVFEEQGVVSGTAFDFDGRSQASMGVAADDADNNGLIDLFLTHFYHESNTLYLQQPGGFFIDDTAAFGLQQPSVETLGFGTQFVDADLDGLPDLVVGNGHVDDYTEQQIPFQMKPQFFRNVGGRFETAENAAAGDFFDRLQLVRGISRVDWNRDGRPDFVAARLIEPAVLQLNETAAVGASIRLRPVRFQHRDPVGTTVSVRCGEKRFVRQLTAGDGFAAGNERIMQIGLGDAAQIDELHVSWPDGETSEQKNVPVNSRFVLFQTGNGETQMLRESEDD